MIYYHDITIEENNILYGPGRRIVLWTQGCTIRCKGCTNKHLYSREGAKTMTSHELMERCMQTPHIEGITLHGGEPTDQIEDLLPVIKKLHESNFSIILFTGREIEELNSKIQLEFLQQCDLVICGPFVQSKLNRNLHFRGSENQRVIKIGDRFANYQIHDGLNMVLLEINDDGIIINKGFPDEQIHQLINDLSLRTETPYDSQRQTSRHQCPTR